MIAEMDEVLSHWLFGILHGMPERPGDFLRSVAQMAFRADAENYAILRPALLELKAKYPAYNDPMKY
jgi:hypothetical protein